MNTTISTAVAIPDALVERVAAALYRHGTDVLDAEEAELAAAAWDTAEVRAVATEEARAVLAAVWADLIDAAHTAAGVELDAGEIPAEIAAAGAELVDADTEPPMYPALLPAPDDVVAGVAWWGSDVTAWTQPRGDRLVGVVKDYSASSRRSPEAVERHAGRLLAAARWATARASEGGEGRG